MNPITKAIDEVKFRIPRQILNIVFADKFYNVRQARANSMDDHILNRVIRPRVLENCDLVGGLEASIPLEGLKFEYTENLYHTVVHIPKARTQGRTINSVLNVAFVSPAMVSVLGTNGMYTDCSTSAVAIGGQAAMNAMTPTASPSTARVQLIGENTVLIHDNLTGFGIGYLNCVLGNDEYMSHLQIRSFLPFCRLCELAVKSYIYNEYVVTLDQGQVQGGHEIGAFKSVIEGYADAETMYQEFLSTKWARVALMNDTISHNKYLRLLVGGFR